MKTSLVIAGLAIVFASCEKMGDINPFDKKDKTCPVVTEESLPSNARTNFNQKYSSATEVVWFDKDGQSFCASFTLNGNETKAFFDLEGNFVSEENEANDEKGNHKDKESGCECDLNDDEGDNENDNDKETNDDNE